MTDFFLSAQGKLDRANEHIVALIDELSQFGNHAPYVVDLHNSPDFTEWWLTVEIREEADFLRWGMMLGDAIQNLHSCLDHAIYGLAFSCSSPKLPPHGDELYFPICRYPGQLFQIAREVGCSEA